MTMKEHLPRLIDLLSNLTKNIAHETNECSMSFMRYLHDIEDKIIEEREKTDAAVAHLGNLDIMAQTYREDQRALEADLADAIAVGERVREEITASRQTMATIAKSIDSMRYELQSVESFSREIKIIAINATIASARAGSVGREFAVISGEVRRLANETAEITERLGPIVDEVLTELSVYTSQSESKGDFRFRSGVLDRLDSQTDTLKKARSSVGDVTTNFEQLIELNSMQQEEKRTTANNIEGSIREALSCAQNGDVIRQQAETIEEMLNAMNRFIRDRDLSQDIREGVDDLIQQFSDKYVMYSQRRVHNEGGNMSTIKSDTSEADLKIELF